jgi:hypothetical protein
MDQARALGGERSAIRARDINEPRISLRSILATMASRPTMPSRIALARHFTDLRATANLLNRINPIPPVQPHRKKYFPSRFPQINSISPAIPSHMRGVSRSSRTLERDAVDADALWTNGAGADGEVVWS